MKMIAGAAVLACWKRSRTRLAPTPTIISTNSDADSEKNGHVRLAGHGAREQRLAGARRAGEQHALGDRAAEPPVAVGVAQEVDDLDELLLGLVDAGDVVERRALLGLLVALGLRAPDRAQRRRPAPLAARRKIQMKSAMIRIVGPKPSSRFASSERPSSIGRAFTTAFSSIRICSSESSANDGRSVLKSVSLFASLPLPIVTADLNSPWIVSPLDVISLTLPFSASARKVVYGTVMRDVRLSGRSDARNQFSASSPTMISTKRRPNGSCGRRDPFWSGFGWSFRAPSTRHSGGGPAAGGRSG